MVGCRSGIGARGCPKPWGVLATHRHRGQRKRELPARRVLVSAPKHQPQGSFWPPPRGPTCTTTPRAEPLGPEHVPRRWQGAGAAHEPQPCRLQHAPREFLQCTLLQPFKKKYITACTLAKRGGCFAPRTHHKSWQRAKWAASGWFLSQHAPMQAPSAGCGQGRRAATLAKTPSERLLRASCFPGRLSSAGIPSSPPAAPLLSVWVCLLAPGRSKALPRALALWHQANRARGSGREARVHAVPWEKHPCRLNYALGFDRLVVKECSTAAEDPARPTTTPKARRQRCSLPAARVSPPQCWHCPSRGLAQPGTVLKINVATHLPGHTS